MVSVPEPGGVVVHQPAVRGTLEILELSRHLGVETIIGVTSHPESELREQSDFVLDMGIIEEPCPLGLTPSASMAVMLAISDAIALALMEAKGVTREDYGLRHHGGYLGQLSRENIVKDVAASLGRDEPVNR